MKDWRIMDPFLEPKTRMRPIRADLQDIGQRLERYRLSRNVTQGQLAQTAGIARSTLSRLEQDGNATLETLLRVLRALGADDRLTILVPDSRQSPLDPNPRERQRARPRKVQPGAKIWGDET
jgi:transcriptional regulator with XRE-family HTH domain